MSGILKLLAVKKSDLETGIVLGKTAVGYTVKVGSQNLSIPAATSDVLTIGCRVVIGRASGKLYILGKEKINDQRIVEVRVNG